MGRLSLQTRLRRRTRAQRGRVGPSLRARAIWATQGRIRHPESQERTIVPLALTITQLTEHTAWNQALIQLPASHVLQTWEWGAFKGCYGWRPSRYLYSLDGQVQAAASVLTRCLAPQLARWASGVMYVPKGPILDYQDARRLDGVLSHLERLARQERALFVKIDPDVRLESPGGEAVVQALRRRGWRPSPEQIQFRNTMLVDLDRSLDDIMAAMKSKWRYNVRLAVRRGVTVRRGTREDLAPLYEMYVETSVRGGFVIRPRDYYLDAWTTFVEAGLAQPLIAEVAEGEGEGEG
ncbi:MAG TPA: peptidoglycan bridge formation glycyltransferase FemA/FemB family protein, partial [Chloroflexi bacterium]|nr:peptidoglycan bridge formation glycyltransferase FemA/FemB family protein [Chloroflexota bacterium]